MGRPGHRPGVRLPVLVLAAALLPLAGCLGDEPDNAALAAYPRTPENYLVLDAWPGERIEPGRTYRYPFHVPDGVALLDLDNHFRLRGGAYPTYRMFYVTPDGSEVAATSQQGSGINGVEVRDPAAGEWVLVIDGSENHVGFDATMWLYACARDSECRIPEAPPERHGHGGGG